MVTNPTFLRVPDPSKWHWSSHATSCGRLDQAVARWLHEGAPRVNSRSHATRPFIPAALFSFFDGAISLPHCSQLIAQHHANSTSQVRTAAQEFTRTEGAHVVDCCRIYHLPPTSSATTPPAFTLYPMPPHSFYPTTSTALGRPNRAVRCANIFP